MIRVITGTGLGVGKTLVSAVLARADHRQGLSVAYLKPVQTGLRAEEPGDAEYVRVAAVVNGAEGFRFDSKFDPAIAAEQAATSVSMDWLVNRTEAMAGTADVLYVESTGGFLTPLTGDLTMADLATRLGAEVVIVTRAGLGTLSIAALTLEAVRARALDFGGYVVNRWPLHPGVIERTTLDRLRRLGSVLGVVRDVDGVDTRRPGAVPAELELTPVGDV